MAYKMIVRNMDTGECGLADVPCATESSGTPTIDVKLVSSKGYNEDTNILTLLMSDGSEVDVNLTKVVSDAVDEIQINHTSPSNTVLASVSGSNGVFNINSDVEIPSLISTDAGNTLTLGSDGKLTVAEVTDVSFADATSAYTNRDPIPTTYHGNGAHYIRPDGFFLINGKKVPYVNS